MVKIGIFSVLYIVPSGTLIVCSAYELVLLPHWERNYLCPFCASGDSECVCVTVCAYNIIMNNSNIPPYSGSSGLSAPDFSVMMLKYFMSLAKGNTSGFWVCSAKTVEVWFNTFSR